MADIGLHQIFFLEFFIYIYSLANYVNSPFPNFTIDNGKGDCWQHS